MPIGKIRIVAAFATILLPGLAMSDDAGTPIDLAAMTIGQPPPGFEFGRTGQGDLGRWIVVADASAQGGRAIAQASLDNTDYRFPLAIHQSAMVKNLDATLRFKPVAGKVDQAGGIAIRLASADDYYVVRANALEDNVRFYRVVKGKRQQLAGINTKVTSGEWHSLGIRAEDNRFAISFDGRPALTATDDTFAEAGKVALWTKADSVTHFDRIAIQTLP
jgi:hypothetical protein